MKQFSIRDLLPIILIAALALGWWLDKRPVPARFQIQAGNGIAYVLDSATGEVWTKQTRADGAPMYESNGFMKPKLPGK